MLLRFAGKRRRPVSKATEASPPAPAGATSPAPPSATITMWHVVVKYYPVILALVVIGGIYAIVSQRYALGPRALIPVLLLALAILLLAATRWGRTRLARTASVLILGVLTVAEAISTTSLVLGLITSGPIGETPHGTAIALLRDAALVWVVNFLTFALWYWEIDGGGPTRRHLDGYHSDDFVFPQRTLDRFADSPWVPHFIDYVFLAFNTSTAFSPTDTLIISARAKLLMMLQAMISLTVLAIIAARAINTL